MSTFAKPENALKRAEELVAVGQKQAALQALHDLITSKRHRAWGKPLEKIMMKYVELCVEMRKGRFAKDGLIQYRIICQQVNVGSLEDVIKHFLKLSTEKAEEAQAAAAAADVALGAVEDLEAESSPEDLMMSFVSGEAGKERSDRETVTPWFKFLWETYRTVLDVLRNNCRLEGLYAMTAHRAFSFCLAYKRTNEFRRLCEILRNHLANLNKYRDQRDRPDLSLPDTLALYVDTRLEQLKTATQLELWQEAFRSVEDIFSLLTSVNKGLKPQQLALYFSRLALIFAKSGHGLYHAYSLLRLHSLLLARTNKARASSAAAAQAAADAGTATPTTCSSARERELTLLASSAVLAALAVSPFHQDKGQGGGGAAAPAGGGEGASAHSLLLQHGAGAGGGESEMERERSARMATLLSLGMAEGGKSSREGPGAEPPLALSRSSLLSEVASRGLLPASLPPVRELFSLLETTGGQLADLPARASALLSSLAQAQEELAAGGDAPAAATAAPGEKPSPPFPLPPLDLPSYVPHLQRLTALRVVQQTSVVFSSVRLSSLSLRLPFLPPPSLLSLLLQASKAGLIHARIDMRGGGGGGGAGCVHFGNKEDLESDGVSSHLSSIALRLSSVLSTLTVEQEEVEAEEEEGEGEDSTLSSRLSSLAAAVDKEHKRLLARKVLIERRKEEQERELAEKEREEAGLKARALRASEEAEAKRLAAESARREEERIRREIEERELAEARALLMEAEKRAGGKGGRKGRRTAEDTSRLSKQQLMEEALAEQQRERAEAEKRQARLARQVDHLERAKREEERPLLQAAYKARQEEDAAYAEEAKAALLAQSARQHAEDLESKRRLAKMGEDKEVFLAAVLSRRSSEFLRLRAEREEKEAEERERRHGERVTLRKMAYYTRQKEEEERRRVEEEARREAEEEAKKRAEVEAKRAAEAERLAKLAEIAEKQRQREAELEERARREREELLTRGGGEAKPSVTAAPPAAKPASGYLPPSLRAKIGGGGGDGGAGGGGAGGGAFRAPGRYGAGAGGGRDERDSSSSSSSRGGGERTGGGHRVEGPDGGTAHQEQQVLRQQLPLLLPHPRVEAVGMANGGPGTCAGEGGIDARGCQGSMALGGTFTAVGSYQ